MAEQTWESTARGRRHRVEASDSGLGRQVTWYVDGDQVAARKTSDERFTLTSDDAGTLHLRFTKLGRGRRATWHPEPGGDGIDLRPEPGSPAAVHEERVRRHPRRHEALAVAGSVAGVVLPILLGLLAVRFALSIPWRPDLPDLPALPVPDLPLPDVSLPDWHLPGWLAAVADAAKYVVPVLVAWAVARAEIRRRRHQDELRSQPDQEHRDED